MFLAKSPCNNGGEELSVTKSLLNKSELAKYLPIEPDDAACLMRRKFSERALVRDGVAHAVRLPCQIDGLELRAACLFHFVAHGLTAISEHVEEFVEHHIGFEYCETPTFLVVGMCTFENVIPA